MGETAEAQEGETAEVTAEVTAEACDAERVVKEEGMEEKGVVASWVSSKLETAQVVEEASKEEEIMEVD